MKHFSKIIIAVVLFVLPLCVSAQTGLKFGHVNSQQLLQMMPEKKAADKALQAEAQELEKTSKALQQELTVKTTAYLKGRETMTEAIRSVKEKEIEDLQIRIQQFNQNAQQSLGKKQAELYGPVFEKARKAVEEVGKENGFLYIFDEAANVVVYKSEQSVDVLPLVKKKLGIQ